MGGQGPEWAGRAIGKKSFTKYQATLLSDAGLFLINYKLVF
jgi:hypothetical protein